MLDKQADPARSKDRIHPQAVARAVSDLAARDAVFVIDTGLNTLWSGNWIRQSGEQRIIGSFNNGAVGTALGQANGIQALDRSRQVIALCGDGGFNMLMCEFLTAVQHKLPVKVVVYNNSSFGLITLEAEVDRAAGLERPSTSPIRIMSRWRAPAARWASRPKSPASCATPSTRRSRRRPGHHRLRGCGRRTAQHPACRSRKGGEFRQGEDQGSDTRSYRAVSGVDGRAQPPPTLIDGISRPRRR